MTKSNYFILIIFLLISNSLHAQEVGASEEESLLEKSFSSIRLSAFYPGLEYNYESRLHSKSTFEFSIGGISGYKENGEFENMDLIEFKRYYISPTVSLGYKYYYTLSSRKEKGKDISSNAGDYFGVSLVNSLNGLIFEKKKYTQNAVLCMKVIEDNFKENYTDWSYVLFIVPKYGLNRNWSNKMGFNFEIGPQLYILNSEYRDVRFDLFVQLGIYLKL